jgi:DNA/RNA endonuclease YhcR with UshA esterase domain
MKSTKLLQLAIFILFLVIITVFTGCAGTTPSVNNFYGFWVNEDTDTPSITKVDIQKIGGIIYVHMWGKCYPTDCDWGIETTNISDATDGTLNLVWNQGFAIKTQELILLSDGRLKVITFCHFTDNSGRPDYESIEFFIKNN